MNIDIKQLSMMQPKRKARLMAFLTFAVIVVLASLYYLYSYKNSILSNALTASPSAAVVINSPADLQTALTALNNTDLSTIDKTLTQNDTDAAQF